MKKAMHLFALAGLALASGSALGQEIVRHKNPNSDFPVAQAVTLPPGTTPIFVSGQVPPVVDKAADSNSVAAYGDMKTQSLGVLNRIKDILAGLGLTMADVVKMQVSLVGDPAKKNRADMKGFMEAYTQFYGGTQPNLPARGVVQVAGLTNPGWLVEIEVTAAKK